jgi:hypothetical protein
LKKNIDHGPIPLEIFQKTEKIVDPPVQLILEANNQTPQNLLSETTQQAPQSNQANAIDVSILIDFN